jgi:hypothetical protein
MWIRTVSLLSVLAGFLLSSATATHQVTAPPKKARPLAYVAWDARVVFVKKADRPLVAQILQVKAGDVGSGQWSLPLSEKKRVVFDVINVDEIPKELVSGSISADPPQAGMRCETVQEASATPECKALSETTSALVTKYRVGECRFGGPTDECTVIHNKAQARFNLYHTPDCTGEPYRTGIVVPGDSCN